MDGDVVYVAEEGGGDGSAEHPFATLADAFAALPSGGTIVVREGTYDAALRWDIVDDLAIHGQCSRLVRLEGADEAPILTLDGARRTTLTLSGLTLSGGSVALEVTGGNLEATDVAIEHTHGVGVSLDGFNASADLSDVTVDRPSALSEAFGAWVTNDASLTWTGGRVTGASQYGVVVAGAHAALSDLTVSGTVAEDEDSAGVYVLAGATATIADCTIADNEEIGVVMAATTTVVNTTVAGNRGVGVEIWGDGTLATLTDVTVDTTLPDENGVGGRGVEVYPGARLVAIGLTLRGNSEIGLWSDGAEVDLSDTTIEDGVPSPANGGGFGLVARGGARVTATDLTLRGNTGWGTAIYEEATLSWEGGEVTGTVPDEDGDGAGVVVQGGATVELVDVVVSGNQGLGISVSDSTLALTDVRIEDTLPKEDGTSGIALQILRGELAVTGLAVAGARGVGVLVTDTSTVEITDLTLSEVSPAIDAALAGGLVIQDGSTATISGAKVSAIEGPALAVIDAVASCSDATLVDARFATVVVLRAELILEDSSLGGVSEENAAGGGVTVLAEANSASSSIYLDNVQVDASHLAGVYLQGVGRYEIVDSDVSGGPTVGMPAMGHAIVAVAGAPAWDGSTGLRIAGCEVHDAGGAGLFLDATGATIEDGTWWDNAVDVTQQACYSVDAVAGVGGLTTDLCPAYDAPWTSVSFELYVDAISVED